MVGRGRWAFPNEVGCPFLDTVDLMMCMALLPVLIPLLKLQNRERPDAIAYLSSLLLETFKN